jgi:hypothetical protein
LARSILEDLLRLLDPYNRLDLSIPDLLYFHLDQMPQSIPEDLLILLDLSILEDQLRRLDQLRLLDLWHLLDQLRLLDLWHLLDQLRLLVLWHLSGRWHL